MDTQQQIPAERSLQWNIGILTAYGTMLLGMGQGDPTLPTLSILTAISAIYFTDRWQWFRLPRSLGNLAAVVALAICMIDFFQDRERQLLAIAHLLVYLQIILLYQQKTPRVYWQLIVLSLLQVVVAAALNEHMNFGLLLVGYLFTSLMAISRLFILRESLRAAQTGVTIVGPVHPALAATPRYNEARSYVQPMLTQTRSEQSAVNRASQSMLGWPWATDLAVFCAGTLVAASLFFFMTPRISGDPWEATGGAASVGFNANDVSLRDLNEIQQSESVVMRVALIDTATETPMQVEDELFLRGVVKSKYNPRGYWENARANDARNPYRLERVPANVPLVRQEVVLEPTNHEYLFYSAPSYAPEGNAEQFRFYSQTMELRTSIRARAEFRYSLLTSGFEGNVQREIVAQPTRFKPRSRDLANFEYMLADEMLEFNPQVNPNVARIAEEQVNELGPNVNDRYTVAKKLEAYFTQPGRFEYTLDPQVARIANGRDLMEVFLTEVKAGHCEYFASALALMLRSRGIPSRLVIGYYGGDYNTVGDYYVVKEKYAHAWVEAYLGPDDIPPGALPPGTDISRGAWLRLNPTPGSIASVEIEQTAWARVSEALDYVEMLWREYVLNLDAERQFDRIYEPLQAIMTKARASLANLLDMQSWNRAIESAAAGVGIDIRGRLNRIEGFYWPAGLVVIMLGVFGIVLMQLGKTVRKTITPVVANGHQREAPPVFYQRFEQLARKHRLERTPGETPRELAHRMHALLISDELTKPAAALPEMIINALYQVRFSGRPLDKPEAEAIENALIGLREALREQHSLG